MAMSEIIQTPNSSPERSWLEICDDEEFFLHDSKKDTDEVVVSKNNQIKSHKVEIKKELDEIDQDENVPANKTPNRKVTVKKESPWDFSYAAVLKTSSSKSKPTPGKETVEKADKIISHENIISGKTIKREIQKDFLKEDLSLSSYLDVFHMESPLKLEPEDEEIEEIASLSKVNKSPKKRPCPPKLSLSEDSVMTDDALMPSPQKVTRFSSRRKREPGESPLTCKRSKQSSGFRNTPRCVVPVEQPPIEIETDEQVLMRRQKQIDYGKNTVGYERYCQMIPMHKRNKRHPQTPPKHIKYSRRAWDGLIKQWRQQLHYWDPPSEGGGNIDDLDISSMSEASSETASHHSSVQSTPKDEHRPRRSTRISTRSSASEASSITDDTGCSPLK